MRGLRCLAILLVAGIAACGTAVFDDTASIVIVNPPPTCPSPWQVFAFAPYVGYSADSYWASSYVKPSVNEAPPTFPIGSTETRWLWETSRADTVAVGLYLPCVSQDGWWRLDVAPRAGVAVPTVAKFCPWGDLSPKGSAPSLRTTVMVTRGRHRAWHFLVGVNLGSPSGRA